MVVAPHGKTLESIAVILLNPPVGRNPSISRWDPVGVIDVKEIKVSVDSTKLVILVDICVFIYRPLIVTPNSLAQQWVDELKAHAPMLRVKLVYEGRTKVPVPITELEARENVTS